MISIEENETKDLSRESIREAIQNFFLYELELQRIKLRTYLRRAQVFLFVGLFVLALCLGLAQSLPISNPPGLIGILREGLVIFGWVSIWKPIELILFDWYPLFEKLRVYKKIVATEVEIQAAPKPAKELSEPLSH